MSIHLGTHGLNHYIQGDFGNQKYLSAHKYVFRCKQFRITTRFSFTNPKVTLAIIYFQHNFQYTSMYLGTS